MQYENLQNEYATKNREKNDKSFSRKLTKKKKNRSMKATKLFRLVYKNVNLFYLLIYDLSISCLQKRKKMKYRIRDEFLFSVRLTYKIWYSIWVWVWRKDICISKMYYTGTRYMYILYKCCIWFCMRDLCWYDMSASKKWKWKKKWYI